MKRLHKFQIALLILFMSLMSIETTWSQPHEVSFNFTDGQQSFVVPNGVHSIHIQAWGAQGADATGESEIIGQDGFPVNNLAVTPLDTTGLGGLGGFAQGDLAVTPGQVLEIFVGGQGSVVNANVPGGGGFNGGGDARGTPSFPRGGGGGASDVRTGGATLDDRVIVAAGGGGAASATNLDGGDGGGLTGSTAGPSPGGGGTQDSGGVGFGSDCLDGEFGLGGGNGPNGICAGGGGGWYGGGAGIGGGGGSSYIKGVTNSDTTSGVRQGDGMVVLTFTPVINVPTLSEWGLIAMTGILGIVGFMVMRKRKVIANEIKD